jgi:membrane-associated protease RseP (regulator of RpoE activity)
VTDYLAPFETFKSYGLRGATVYRGRIRAEYALDREKLAETLGEAPGEYHLETFEGWLYATLRVDQVRRPRRLWLHATLLALTIITTIGAGADIVAGTHDGFALRPFRLIFDAFMALFAGDGAEFAHVVWPRFVEDAAAGLPYSVALLFILLAHELGHYFAARRYRIDATLPFLLPAPFFFGTFGAVIKMRSPISHRRQLFDVGAAGPACGIVASIIVCCIGLNMSTYVQAGTTGLPFELGRSLLFRLLALISIGPGAEGAVLKYHSVAVAGWFGLFITFLNMMPMGQLDGGHISYALLGKNHRFVALVAFGMLVGMGFVFPAWPVLALLVLFVVKLRHPPVMDESIPLGFRRRFMAVVLLLLFVLMFMPQPIVLNWH